MNRCPEGWELTLKDLTNGTTRKEEQNLYLLVPVGISFTFASRCSGNKGIWWFSNWRQWLVCDNPEIVEKHEAKVYGLSLGAAPTMAVSHLDSRWLDGKKTLLFGPYAAWTRVLHRGGSFLVFFNKISYILTLIRVGICNIPLVGYLVPGSPKYEYPIKGAKFYPDAEEQDWKLIDAGIRVQAIKKRRWRCWNCHFGTEDVTTEDKTISALLGASPGASVCVNIVLEVAQKCFPKLCESKKEKIKEVIPTYDMNLGKISTPSEIKKFQKLYNDAEGTLELKKQF